MTLQRTSSVYLWKAVAKEWTALHRAAVGPNCRSLGTPRKAREDAQYRSERQRRSWRQCGRTSFRDKCKPCSTSFTSSAAPSCICRSVCLYLFFS